MTSRPWGAAGAALAGRLGPGGTQLFQRSALIFGSTAVSRLVGFGFPVIAARALGPVGFGLVTFVLTLANLVSIPLFNSPAGLSRALARARDVREQHVILANYAVVVGVLLGADTLLAIPLGWSAGLRGWVLVGLVTNLAGITAIAFYQELQRGRERFREVAVYNVASNAVQLAAVAAFWRAGLDIPALYIIAFGLSSVAAIAAVRPLGRLDVRADLRDVSWRGIRAALRFVAPLVLQTAFFMLWSSTDVVVLKQLGSIADVGEYGAAKSMANGAQLVPSAIATVVLPQAARLPTGEARRYFVRLLAYSTSAAVPPLLGLVILGPWLLQVVFGPAYLVALLPLVILATGMAMYGVYLTLEASWIAMNRPVLPLIATAVSALVTLALLVPLVHLLGMTGAALGLTAGSAAKLAILLWASLGSRFGLRRALAA